MVQKELIDKIEKEWGEFIEEEKFREVGEKVVNTIVGVIKEFKDSLNKLRDEQIKNAMIKECERIISKLNNRKKLVGEILESVAKLVEFKLQFIEMYLEDMENLFEFKENMDKFLDLCKTVSDFFDSYNKYKNTNRKLANVMKFLGYMYYGIQKKVKVPGKIKENLRKFAPKITLISAYEFARYYSYNILKSLASKSELSKMLQSKVEEFKREYKSLINLIKSLKKELKSKEMKKIKKRIKSLKKQLRKGRKEEIEIVEEKIKQFEEIFDYVNKFVESLVNISKITNNIIKDLRSNLKDYRKVMKFGKVRSGPLAMIQPKYLGKVYKKLVIKLALKGKKEKIYYQLDELRRKYDYLFFGKRGIMRKFIKITNRFIKNTNNLKKLEKELEKYIESTGEKEDLKVGEVLGELRQSIIVLRKRILLRFRLYKKYLEKAGVSGIDFSEIEEKFKKIIEQMGKEEKKVEKEIEEVLKYVEEEEKAIEEVSNKIVSFMEATIKNFETIKGLKEQYESIMKIIEEVEKEGERKEKLEEEASKIKGEIEKLVMEVFSRYDELVSAIRKFEAVFSIDLYKEFSDALVASERLSKKLVSKKFREMSKEIDRIASDIIKEVKRRVKILRKEIRELEKQIKSEKKLLDNLREEARRDKEKEIENLENTLKNKKTELEMLIKDIRFIKQLRGIIKSGIKEILDLYKDISEILSLKYIRKEILSDVKEMEKNIESIILDLDDNYEDVYEFYVKGNYLGALGKALYMVCENSLRASKNVVKIELVKNPEKVMKSIQSKINKSVKIYNVEIIIKGDSIDVNLIKNYQELKRITEIQGKIVGKLIKVVRRGKSLEYSSKFAEHCIEFLRRIGEYTNELLDSIVDAFDDNYDMFFTTLWRFSLVMRNFISKLNEAKKDINKGLGIGMALIKENIGRFEILKSRIMKKGRETKMKLKKLAELKKLPIFRK